MTERREVSSCGGVFNEIADEYDHHRPSYPDALVDRAFEVAGLSLGTWVLEIGCGTGQLTRSLLERGLRVVAVEPGAELIAGARERLAGAGEVQFINARLEDAPLRHAYYRAVFSASAIHWVDPDLSWRKVADTLVDGGTLALVSYFGLEDPSGGDDQQALRAALERAAPNLADQWPRYRDLDGMLAGASERAGNVSELWAWLGSYELGRSYAAELFEAAELVAMPKLVEHTAAELSALLGTMSFWSRLSSRRRDALVAENHALQQRLGRPIRSSVAACLVTARRAKRS